MSMYPLESGDAEAAMAASMSAAEQHQSHYQANIAGFGATVGDPMDAGESAEQPDVGDQQESVT